jgi:hypothetical protein
MNQRKPIWKIQKSLLRKIESNKKKIEKNKEKINNYYEKYKGQFKKIGNKYKKRRREKDKVTKMEKENKKLIQLKHKISSLVVYAGFLTSLITSVSVGQTMKLKKNLETDYETAKIEYYKEIEEENKKNEEQAQEQYEQEMKNYEKELKETAQINAVSIPNKYKNLIVKELTKESDYKKYGIITKSDLMTIKTLEIETDIDTSFDFMKYCINLEKLTILCPKESMNKLSKLAVMPNLKKFTLCTNTKTLNIETAQSLYEKMPSLEELSLPTDVVIEPGILESMTKLKTIEINPYLNCDIDFKKLTFLEELKISSTKPYDIAIWFNTDEYNYLKENGVKLTFKPGIEEKYLKITNQMDEILEEIGVDENTSDDEILDAILYYTVKNYEYDEEINKYTRLELIKEQPSKEFYKDGNLYAILEKEKQICGNYASFIEAMYDRLKKPEDSYTLISDNHAWNQIEINGKKYYVDSTWLDTGKVYYDDEIITADQVADMGKLDELTWYKENPKSGYFKIIDDGTHDPINMPNYEESGYTIKEFNPTFKEPQKIAIKTLEQPTINMEKVEKINANTDSLEKEKQEKEVNYDKKMTREAEIAIASFIVALATRINDKRKKKEEQKTR